MIFKVHRDLILRIYFRISGQKHPLLPDQFVISNQGCFFSSQICRSKRNEYSLFEKLRGDTQIYVEFEIEENFPDRNGEGRKSRTLCLRRQPLHLRITKHCFLGILHWGRWDVFLQDECSLFDAYVNSLLDFPFMRRTTRVLINRPWGRRHLQRIHMPVIVIGVLPALFIDPDVDEI